MNFQTRSYEKRVIGTRNKVSGVRDQRGGMDHQADTGDRNRFRDHGVCNGRNHLRRKTGRDHEKIGERTSDNKVLIRQRSYSL